MADGNALALETKDTLGQDPKYLLPQMGGLSVAEPVTYRSLFLLDAIDDYLKPPDGAAAAPATNKIELTEAIDPFDESKLANEYKSKPAVGVLMVHRQSWVQSGLALGNLLQSICLAPGEVTRVAVVDWRRREVGTSAAATDQSEGVTSSTSQDRSVNEVQNAVTSEAQSGASSALSLSASLQGAASLNTLFASANMATAANSTSALTAQFSVGSRNLGVTSTNAISARTAEASQALRSRRQTVVREVSQQESEQTSSRILANYNRRHSLNVEYFEVLQKYSVKTQLAGWERCLFVPMRPIDFSDVATIRRHRTDLMAISAQLGANDLSKALSEVIAGISRADQSEEQKNDARQVLQKRDQFLVNLLSCLDELYSYQRSLKTVSADDHLRKGIIERNITENKKKFNDLVAGSGTQAVKRIGDEEEISAQLYEKYHSSLLERRISNKNESDRLELTIAVPLPEILNSARMFLSQMIWMRMDSYRIYRALAPYTIDGKSISSLVDPHPIGFFGNYLAFRWGFSRDDAGDRAREAFKSRYLKQDDTTADGGEIALPTSGVFAEAVLGRGEAAEELDDHRFGKWSENQPPILPPEIDKLTSRDRGKTMDFSVSDFAAALAQLRGQPLADASFVGSILGGATKGDSFRNMGGLDHAIELAGKVAALSEKGATRAGDRNAEMQAKFLDTFVQVLNSDVGKAAVAEFMLPGAGPLMLQEAAKRGSVLSPPSEARSKPADASAGESKPPSAAAGGDGQGAGTQGEVV